MDWFRCIPRSQGPRLILWRSIFIVFALPIGIARADGDDAAAPPFESHSIVAQWIDRWERETESMVDPRIRDDAAGTLLSFWDSFCTDGITCTSLFSSSDSAYRVIEAYLEANATDRRMTTTLLEGFALAVGSRSANIGFPSVEDRGLASVSFDRQLAVTLQVKGRGVVTARYPVKRLLLRSGDYVASNSAWALAIKIREVDGVLTGMSAITTSVIEAAPTSRIGLPWEYVCPEFRSASVESKPVYGPGRDRLIQSPAPFYSSKQLTVSIIDRINCREGSCRDALHRNILDALSLWRSACTRCPDDLLAAVSIDGQWYASESYAYANVRGPTSKALRKAAEMYVPVERLPEQLKQDTPSASMTITLGSRPKACAGGSDVIGCASVDKGIEINTEDYQFMDGDMAQFGVGARKVEAAIVFLHEIGHWFGIPHADVLLTPADDRHGLMESGYRGLTQCMSNGDATLLEEVSDMSSSFRLKECDGFLYRVDNQSGWSVPELMDR